MKSILCSAITKMALIGVLLVCFISSCSRMPSSRRKERVMGTMNEMIVMGGSRMEREEALQVAFEELKQLERKLSHWDSQSEIARINRDAYSAPQKISSVTFEVIHQAKTFFDESAGTFDVTVYPLMKLWGFYQKDPDIPAEEDIRETLKSIGSDGILLKMQEEEVRLARPGMGIDLGAIGKGYACDRVVRILQERGISSALVNIGGTIYAYGRSPEGRKWRVGLRHPRDHTRTFKVITLDGQAVSTSGDYENFFIKDGKRYPHLIDPRTGYLVQGSVAVSVIAPTALLADYLSTAIFVLGAGGAPQLAARYPDVQWHLIYLDQDERFQSLSSPALT